MIDVPAIASPSLPFAATITPQERRAGFVAIPISIPPFHAVVATIDNRRLAVKVATAANAISYAIVDRDNLKPLDAVATLAELRAKYPPVN